MIAIDNNHWELCDSHCSRCFPWIFLYNPLNKYHKLDVIISYSCRNWAIARLSNLQNTRQSQALYPHFQAVVEIFNAHQISTWNPSFPRLPCNYAGLVGRSDYLPRSAVMMWVISGWNIKEWLYLLHCWWECKLVQPLWRTVGRLLKNLEINLPGACQVIQSCPTLCDPMDYSPPRSSVYGILQARILEWVAMPSSRGFSWPRDQTHIYHISWVSRWVLYH